MKPEIFTVNILVTSEVIDQRNHVNNLAYLNWCMEAASSHWNLKSSDQQQETYMWYVLHHDAHYKAAAFLDDQLVLSTWVSGNKGVRSTRSFKIVRNTDQKLLMHATTTWCLLNANTQKPTKITDEIRNLFTY